MNDYRKNPCKRCGHSPDWHSFKDGINGGSTDITSPDALFSCNGPHFNGCDTECPDFLGEPLTWLVDA
jgi:hypothetical protein